MDQNTSISSGARGEEKSFGDDRVYKKALAQQFERLYLLTANHDEESKGIRIDLNRLMEYLMRHERGPRNRREKEEVNVRNEGRGRRGVRTKPKMEEYDELDWDKDEFKEPYELENYQVGGRGFGHQGVEELEVGLVGEISGRPSTMEGHALALT
ncbi:hypothetical protein GH714_032596 [Hevea brasiliensis]|uniref:Uncharacterized protein n=1 Tax=Hevea brasiliensis TaxID=3981 RepID=A0A6A6L321_HEVBR|nr:hypothetical protein GH714_032596 [Hevea brasiliensis]